METEVATANGSPRGPVAMETELVTANGSPRGPVAMGTELATANGSPGGPVAMETEVATANGSPQGPVAMETETATANGSPRGPVAMETEIETANGSAARAARRPPAERGAAPRDASFSTGSRGDQAIAKVNPEAGAFLPAAGSDAQTPPPLAGAGRVSLRSVFKASERPSLLRPRAFNAVSPYSSPSRRTERCEAVPGAVPSTPPHPRHLFAL